MPAKPPPPWRDGPYTPILNTLALALASSDLTKRATAAFLVILTETWGHPGKWKRYGRESAPVSLTLIAREINVHVSTARRALEELEAKGWVARTEAGSGRHAVTWKPTLTPPPAQAPEPAEPVTDDRPATGEERAVISEWLAAKQDERRREAIRNGMGTAR
jgi:hypothetical protein